MSVVIPKKKRRNHHANPTATVMLTEQEILALLLVVRAHYDSDPDRPWKIAAQTRAEKKLHKCLVEIAKKKMFPKKEYE